jgi:chromosomal replication initiator protein
MEAIQTNQNPMVFAGLGGNVYEWVKSVTKRIDTYSEAGLEQKIKDLKRNDPDEKYPSAMRLLREALYNKRQIWGVVETIKIVCASEFGIPYRDIDIKTKKREVVQARQVAHFICRNRTKLSLSEIGIRCGQKDHATVLFSYKTVKNLYQTDRNYRDVVNRILLRLDAEKLKEELLKQPKI